MAAALLATPAALGAFVAPVAVPAQRAAVSMSEDGVSYLGRADGMRESYAPSTMGKEYVNAPRKPLSEYVGTSIELAAFPGGNTEAVPWDPMGFSELYKISGNNPDVAWLREAELKHGRMSMMAIVGIMIQESGIHDPYWAPAESTWYDAPTQVPALAWGGLLVTIGLIEGTYAEGLYDLWNGQTDKREPGDYGWGKKYLSKDPKAADKMRLRELKNGRLAMMAFIGVASNHFLPGALPGCMYN